MGQGLGQQRCPHTCQEATNSRLPPASGAQEGWPDAAGRGWG